MLPNACPKPRPKLLDKRQRQAAVDKVDREQKAICRARSGGRCEVTVLQPPQFGRVIAISCFNHASENHHLIGGSGRRNKGRSILAAHRLDVCDRCHEDITGKVLIPAVPQDKAECAATVRYERVR